MTANYFKNRFAKQKSRFCVTKQPVFSSPRPRFVERTAILRQTVSRSVWMVVGWMDNVFIERLWRSLKYEEVYLNAYESVRSAEQGIGKWFNLYNSRRRHQVIKLTPDEAYSDPEMKVAA